MTGGLVLVVAVRGREVFVAVAVLLLFSWGRWRLAVASATWIAAEVVLETGHCWQLERCWHH